MVTRRLAQCAPNSKIFSDAPAPGAQSKDAVNNYIEPWQPAPDARTANADANFPDHTFLHVLFGHRSMDELEHIFRDCWVKEDSTRELVKALFPKRASHVWSID